MPSKIKKRSKGYLLTVVHDQKEYTKMSYATTKTAALSEWDDFKMEIKRGNVVAKIEGNMTLDQFYLYWYEHYAELNLGESTKALLKIISYRISAALGHLTLSEVKQRHILAFQKILSSPTASIHKTPLSSSYIKRHFDILNLMFNSAVDWGFIAENPMKKIKTPKRKKTKKETPDEKTFAKFISAIDEHDDIKHRLWVALAFTLGLRREEIFGLKWRDIDLPARILSVERATVYVSGKGIIIKETKTENGTRRIPIPDTVCSLFGAWKQDVLAAAKKRNARNKVVDFHDPLHSDNFVFTKPSGDVAHPHSFNTFLRKFCAKTGIPNIAPHTLRHLYGSYLVANNINIATVSSLMGHANKAFTLSTYIHEIKSIEHQTADIMADAFKKLKQQAE